MGGSLGYDPSRGGARPLPCSALAVRRQICQPATLAMNEPVILVIEDDAAVRRGVLPGPSGFDILQALRRKRRGQAVIILSARGEENDRVRGLTNGADDYVVKPFSMKELLARVDAVLRRTCERAAPSDERPIAGGVADFGQRQLVFEDGRHEELSEREAELLRYLMDSAGRLVTREEILQHVWHLNPNRTETRTIDMHIMHLRTKLGDKDQANLVTVRGKGYRFGGHPSS